MDAAVEECIEKFKNNGTCEPGDAVVVVAGTIQHKGATNLMRVHYA